MVRAVFFAVILVIVAIYSRETSAATTSCSGQNQEFTTCGTPCPPACDVSGPRICTMQCTIGCQCESGYLLNDNGACVAPKDC